MGVPAAPRSKIVWLLRKAGRALLVLHPDFVAVGQRRVAMIGADDSWSVVEPLMVAPWNSMDPPRGHRRTPAIRKSDDLLAPLSARLPGLGGP